MSLIAKPDLKRKSQAIFRCKTSVCGFRQLPPMSIFPVAKSALCSRFLFADYD
jgi:hypothetical protein